MRLARKCLFAAAACALVLLATEVGLRLAGVEPVLDQEDPFQGFSGQFRAFAPDGEVFRTRHGSPFRVFRDQTFAVTKPADGLRLFTLGGSSAFGFPWDAAAAFPALLGTALQESHPDRAVESINAAGMSYAMHRLRLLARELLEYEPDCVLVYSGHNEFVERAHFGDLERRSGAVFGLLPWLLETRLGSLAYRLAAGGSPPGPDEVASREEFVRRRTPDVDDRRRLAVVESFRQDLAALVDAALARDIHVVLTTVPCNLRDWAPERSAVPAALPGPARSAWEADLEAGRAGLEAGDFRAALARLDRALAVVHDHAETHFLRGRCLEALGRPAEADQAYRRACDLDAYPIRRTSALNDAVREIAGRSGVLLVDLDRIFAEHSPDGLVGFSWIEDYVHPTREGHVLIARSLWEALDARGWWGPGRPVDAADLAALLEAQAREAAQPTPAFLYNQGVVLEKQGLLERAAAKYREALAQGPHSGALGNLGRIDLGRGDFAEAAACFREFLALDPDHPGALLDLGKALAGLGQTTAARTALRHALELDPALTAARLELARSAAGEGELDMAIREYREVLRASPDEPAILHELSRVLLRDGRVEEARETLDRLLALRPDDAVALAHRGIALDARGDREAAETDLRRALELDPGLVAAQRRLGLLLGSTGRTREAIPLLQAAAAGLPGDLEIRAALGVALLESGNRSGAENRFREVLRGDPASPAANRGLLSLLLTSATSGSETRSELLPEARAAVERTRGEDGRILLLAARIAASVGAREEATSWASEARRRAEEAGDAASAREAQELETELGGDEARPTREDLPDP
jgi:Flp pilus assembly protein TadD